jgi:hypothetical protein
MVLVYYLTLIFGCYPPFIKEDKRARGFTGINITASRLFTYSVT